MKKILLFALIIMMLLSVTAYAEGEITEVTAETEIIVEEPTVEPIAEPTAEPTVETEVIDEFTAWLTNITSGTSIATLITAILGFGGTGALVASKLKAVLELLKGKADGNTVSKALTESKNEITAKFTEELDTLKENLKKSEERERMLTAILGIAFSYSKEIPASARAQINTLLNGTSAKCDTVKEMVDIAKTAIEEAEKTKEKIETPELDKIVGMNLE